MVIGPGFDPASESSVSVPPETFVALVVPLERTTLVLPTMRVVCVPLTLTVDVMLGGLGPTSAANAEAKVNMGASSPVPIRRKPARVIDDREIMTLPEKRSRNEPAIARMSRLPACSTYWT